MELVRKAPTRALREKVRPYAETLRAFHVVSHKCFGPKLKDGWEESIKDYKKKFMIMAYANAKTEATKAALAAFKAPKGTRAKAQALAKAKRKALVEHRPISLKSHIMFHHLEDFIR